MSTTGAIRARDRRALIIGGALVGGMLLFSRVLPVISGMEDALRSDRELVSRKVATARLLARESLDLINALDPTGNDGRTRELALTPILRSPTATAAAASLLTRVSGLAEFAGANVLSAGVTGDTAFRDEHAEVGTRMSLSLDDVALVRLISAVEADPIRLAIGSLHIVRANPAAVGLEARALRVEMVVTVIARRDEPSFNEVPRVAAQ